MAAAMPQNGIAANAAAAAAYPGALPGRVAPGYGNPPFAEPNMRFDGSVPMQAPQFAQTMGYTPQRVDQNEVRNMRPVTVKAQFEDKRHVQDEWMTNMVLKVVEQDTVEAAGADSILGGIYRVVTAEPGTTIQIQTDVYYAGVAGEQPDFGTAYMLPRSTNRRGYGMSRFAVGIYDGMWYSMSDEWAEQLPYRMDQIRNSFTRVAILRCLHDLCSIQYEVDWWTQYGLACNPLTCVDKEEALTIAARHHARQFGILGRKGARGFRHVADVTSKGLRTRGYELTAVFGPPGLETFGLRADIDTDPKTNTEAQANAAAAGRPPMNELGVRVLVAKPLKVGANAPPYIPLVHQATIGLVHYMMPPERIRRSGRGEWQAGCANPSIYDFKLDDWAKVNYLEAVRKSGIFRVAANGRVEGASPLSQMGTDFFNAVSAEIRAADQQIGRNADVTVEHYLRHHQLYHDLNKTAATRVDFAARWGGILATSLLNLTYGVFEQLDMNDVPPPFPIMLLRPNITFMMGSLVGLDLRDAIGICMMSGMTSTSTVEARQATLSQVNQFIGVVQTRGRAVEFVYNVVPVEYQLGGCTKMFDLTNDVEVASFRHFGKKQTQVPSIIPVMLTPDECERLSRNRAVAPRPPIDVNDVNRRGDASSVFAFKLADHIQKRFFARSAVSPGDFFRGANHVLVPNRANKVCVNGGTIYPVVVDKQIDDHSRRGFSRCELFGDAMGSNLVSNMVHGMGVQEGSDFC